LGVTLSHVHETIGAFRTLFSENLINSNLEFAFRTSFSLTFSEKSWARFSFATLCTCLWVRRELRPTSSKILC